MTSLQDAEELVTDLLVRIGEMEQRWVVHGSVTTYMFGAVRSRVVDYRERVAISVRRTVEIEGYLIEESIQQL